MAIRGVSVDPPETSAALVRDARIGFPILSDPQLAMIDAYGLRHPDGHDGHDIALSASVLIDGDGIVRWVTVAENLRVRPTSADVLAAVRTLAASPH